MIKKPWQIWSLFGLILLVVLPAMVWLTMQINESDRLREVDRQETELARRQAELQERINSALYRMDFWATPLVAQEAARPYYLYEPFYQVEALSANSADLSLAFPQQAFAQTAQSAQQTQPQQIQAQGAQSPARTNLPNLAPQQALIPQQFGYGGGNGVIQKPSPLLFGTSDYVVMHFQITPDNRLTSPQRPVGDGQLTAMAMCNVPEDSILDNDANLNIASEFLCYETIVARCPALPALDTNTDIQLTPQQQTQPKYAQVQTIYRDARTERFSNWDSPEQLQQPVPQGPAAPVKGGKGAYGGGKGSKSEQQTKRNVERGNREYSQRAQTAALNTNNKFQDMMFSSPGFNDLALAPNELEVEPDSSDQQSAFMPPFNTTQTKFVREGVMRPLWVDDRLILARRVEGVDKQRLQCCWLDWEKIHDELKLQIADLLPECELQPVKQEQDLSLARAMATLPIQLVVNSDKLLSTLALNSDPQIANQPSPLKLSMMIAWLGLGAAALASAVLLRGVIKLSERRAAFVSAVTHELRTPLTTFRMYSEMLAEEMVPDDKRGEYAETLTHEADRLSNLVENVLQFAKLERGAGEGRIESLNILDLIGRFEDRLHHRANTMEMQLAIDLGDTAQTLVSTDPSKVEQIVFNLVDNACKYAAHGESNQIELVVQQAAGRISISVRDYGPGVAAKFRKSLFKPFCKSDQDAADTSSGVGLGLALCQQMAKSIGGRVSLADCEPGAKFVLNFPAA